MKVIGTATIALVLLASGSAFAHGDGDGYRRHGHDRGFGRHHERYYGDYGRHERRYYGSGYYRPEVGYYAAPVYVAPPPPVIYGTYGYRYPQPRDGVTVILPPIRIGF